MSGIYQFLWLVPALPFAGFVVLALAGRSMPHKAVSAVGVGSIGVSMLISIAINGMFLTAPPHGRPGPPVP